MQAGRAFPLHYETEQGKEYPLFSRRCLSACDTIMDRYSLLNPRNFRVAKRVLIPCSVILFLIGMALALPESPVYANESLSLADLKQRVEVYQAELDHHAEVIRKLEARLAEAKSENRKPDISGLHQLATAAGQRTQAYHQKPDYIRKLIDDLEHNKVLSAIGVAKLSAGTAAGEIEKASIQVEVQRTKWFRRMVSVQLEKTKAEIARREHIAQRSEAKVEKEGLSAGQVAEGEEKPDSGNRGGAGGIQRERLLHSLDKLERRLAAVEGRIPELERMKKEFDSEQQAAKTAIEQQLHRVDKLTDEANAIAKETLTALTMPRSNITSQIKQVRSRTGAYKKAYNQFAKAEKNIAGVQNRICGYKDQLSAQPPPGVDQLKGWKHESGKDIKTAAIALQMTADEVEKKRAELTAMTQALKPGLDQLELLLALFSRRSSVQGKINSLFGQAGKELTVARDLKRKKNADLTALARRYNKMRNDLIGDGVNIHDDVALQLANANRVKQWKLATKAENLLQRVKSVNKRTTMGTRYIPKIELPEAPEAVRRGSRVGKSDYVEVFDKFNIFSNTAPVGQQQINMYKDGRNAIHEAGSVLVDVLLVSNAAKQLMKQAMQCNAALQQAPENTCNRREIVSLIDKHAGHYRQCQYDDADAKLDAALTWVNQHKECSAFTPDIREKKKLVSEARQENQRAKGLYKEARSLYKEHCYQRAMRKLEESSNTTQCGKVREKLTKKITLVKQAENQANAIARTARSDLRACRFKQAREGMGQLCRTSRVRNRLEALLSRENDAHKAYNNGVNAYRNNHLNSALRQLKFAKKRFVCRRHIAAADNLIGKITNVQNAQAAQAIGAMMGAIASARHASGSGSESPRRVKPQVTRSSGGGSRKARQTVSRGAGKSRKQCLRPSRTTSVPHAKLYKLCAPLYGCPRALCRTASEVKAWKDATKGGSVTDLKRSCARPCPTGFSGPVKYRGKSVCVQCSKGKHFRNGCCS